MPKTVIPYLSIAPIAPPIPIAMKFLIINCTNILKIGSRHKMESHPFARMRLRVEPAMTNQKPAMTSLVIPDLIRDPVHPFARMNDYSLRGVPLKLPEFISLRG